jgi:hypothetical protein
MKQGGEMNQALYAHMNNKRKRKKKRIFMKDCLSEQDVLVICMGIVFSCPDIALQTLVLVKLT